MTEYLLIPGGIGLFIAGLYTGLYLARHSYRDIEVPKIVEVDKLVEVEKPVIVQVPRTNAPAPASLPIMGTERQNVQTPGQRDEAAKITSLLDQLPE